jgi:ATP-dependent exoDNAse (exonuclease V) beta subunit
MWREYLSADGESGLVLSPLSAAGTAAEDPIYRHLRFEDNLSSMLENTRLLYVAATRAVSQLYLTFTVSEEPEEAGWSGPDRRSLLSPVWQAVSKQVIWHNQTVIEREQIGFDFVPGTATDDSRRLTGSWQSPEWSVLNPLSDYYLDADYDNAEVLPSQCDDIVPRVVGTVIHAILERLAEHGADQWLQQSASQRQQWLDSLLHYYQLPPQDWPRATDIIVPAISNTLADTKGRWLLSNKHQLVKTEWSLLSAMSVRVREFIIDRLFVDDDCRCWIVDYKTGRPTDGETKEAFVQREIVSYQQQLMEYRHLLETMGFESVHVALYFTHYPHWQEVESFS